MVYGVGFQVWFDFVMDGLLVSMDNIGGGGVVVVVKARAITILSSVSIACAADVCFGLLV